MKKIKEMLTDIKDLFAWIADDLPMIDLRVMSHELLVCKEARPMAQEKQRMGEEKRLTAAVEVQKLLDA